MKLRLEVPRFAGEPGSPRIRVDVASHANTPYRDSAWTAPTGDRVFLFGYLNDPSAYTAGDDGDAASGPARAAYRAYASGGIDAAAQLNGLYAVFVEDAKSGTVHVGIDKFGMFPLFYAELEGTWVFSTDFESLWRDRNLELHAEALEEWVVLGYPLGGRTFFRDVTRMTWSSTIRIEPSGALTTGDSPGLSIFDQEAHSDEERAVAENQAAFEATIADMLAIAPKRLCLLSSGYDSRRIYLEMRRQGAEPHTYTIAEFKRTQPTPESIEEMVTLALTDGSSAPHELMPFPAGDQWENAFARRDEVLGLQVNMHEWLIPLADLVGRGSGTNLDGFAGDTLCNSDIAVCPTERAMDWEDTDAISRVMVDTGFKQVFSDEFLSRLDRPIHERLAEEIERIPAGSHRIFFMEVLGRGRRSTTLCPLLVFGERVGSLMPYLDDRMVRASVNLDLRMKLRLQFQRLQIDRHYPEYASVPSSHTNYADVPDQYKKPLPGILPDRYAHMPPRLALNWAQIAHALRFRPRGSFRDVLSGRARMMLTAAAWARRLRVDRWAPNAARKFWPVPNLVHAERIVALTR